MRTLLILFVMCMFSTISFDLCLVWLFQSNVPLVTYVYGNKALHF